jgi:short subunit dehydrogenase-like uncharacterized protein
VFTYKPWLLYGATGRTGTALAEEAVARGHRPVLAGRDPQALRTLAERLGLTWVAGPASDMARLIGETRLVLLAAGPFGATAPAALRAALEAGVDYLDIANDIPVAVATLAADGEARRRGITALPAVGFGTVASDGLARHVADQLPGAVRLDLAILSGTDGSSAGARASTRQAWAMATAADGRTAEAWLRTGEGYAYTARSAVLEVEATLASEPLGATTVARAFGPGLSLAAGGEILAAA